MQFGDVNQPLFVISVAAELAEMHPQTLRQYDRLGLVTPSRLPGRARRYSQKDVVRLRQIQQLSHEGVSLEGIKRVLQLENQVDALQARVRELTQELQDAQDRLEESSRVFAATIGGDVVKLGRGQRPSAKTPSKALAIARPQLPYR
ncbi:MULTISPECIES: heat shock protein transcriptional repressor HspR [Micrococcaceae]|uniref:heat shock protein transcriptional repressor HspR n=1 Tax=unclassified Kocuria TaxID=2649579 RepID=UPI0010118072|nr:MULTISPECIES: helix-turn-helix transcriptional regulator [unclassified Kocuria]